QIVSISKTLYYIGLQYDKIRIYNNCVRITPFPNHLKNKENRENMLIDMEEAHLAHDRERRRRKIDEETNEELNEETDEEREAHSVVEEEARRALARKKYSLIAKETPNQIAARLSQKKS
ncbi:18927_t:CDS:2, partial [Rhizophagus irregularis]